MIERSPPLPIPSLISCLFVSHLVANIFTQPFPFTTQQSRKSGGGKEWRLFFFPLGFSSLGVFRPRYGPGGVFHWGDKTTDKIVCPV